MKRTLYSIGTVLLLVLSLFPVAMAQEEGSETAPQPTVELLDISALQEAVAEAEAQQEYAKANYQITMKIVTADGVIDYMTENYPDADITALESYRQALIDLRDSLTLESEFSDVMQEMSSLIDEGKEAVNDLIVEHSIDKEELKAAVDAYTEESTVDDEAKEAWGEARGAAVYARANVILAGLDNYRIVAEQYVDAEALEEFNAKMDELNAKIDELAAAVTSFDDETTKTAMEEVKSLIKEVKDIAKDLKEVIKEARQAAGRGGQDRDAIRFKPVPREFDRPNVDDTEETETVEEDATEETEATEESTEETETTEETEATEESSTEETETTVEAEAEVIAEVE